MESIRDFYWMVMCGIFIANSLGPISRTYVGAIGLFGIIILLFIIVAIAIVIFQLCQAINSANPLLVQQKLLMAFHYTKRLFKRRSRNEPDRQIQLEA